MSADKQEVYPTYLHKLIEEERDQLRAEVAELRAWKEGKKGVEEYYQACSERDQLRARVAELEAQQREDTNELAELDKDKARLDWLEANALTVLFNEEFHGDIEATRQAIDAAREKGTT